MSREAKAEVTEFLEKEAELIDDCEFDDWLGVMAEDVEYRVPVRETRDRGQSEFGDAYHVHDNRYRIEKRVERLKTQHAWAEDPPTATRHYVTNVRIEEGGGDASENEIHAKSNLLLSVNYAWLDDPDPKIVSGERHDVLRRDDEDELKLADRTVYLDQTLLPLPNVSFFI